MKLTETDTLPYMYEIYGITDFVLGSFPNTLLGGLYFGEDYFMNKLSNVKNLYTVGY